MDVAGAVVGRTFLFFHYCWRILAEHGVVVRQWQCIMAPVCSVFIVYSHNLVVVVGGWWLVIVVSWARFFCFFFFNVCAGKCWKTFDMPCALCTIFGLRVAANCMQIALAQMEVLRLSSVNGVT